MKKVAYIVSGLSLSMTFVVNEMEAHEKAGWKVLPLLNCKSYSFENLSELMVKWNKQAFFRPNIFVNIAATVEEIIKNPVRFLKVCRWLTILLFYSPSEFAKACYELTTLSYFAHQCRSHGIEHIHVHFASRSLTLGLMLGMLTDLPVSCTVHAFDIFTRPAGSLRLRLSMCKFIAAISKFNIEYLRKKCGDKIADLCHVIHCGIDLDRFRTLTHKPEPGKIAAVARLDPKKGFDIAIKACAELRKENLDFVFEIVGTGTEYQRLADLIKQLELQNYVKLLGPKANDCLLPFLNIASLFLMPCTKTPSGDMDGIPVAMMEAMVCKVPVISTKISGIPELVQHNINGLLVEEGNIKELAEAIRCLISDPEKINRFGQAAREHVQENFNIIKTSEKLRQLILKG